MHVDDFDLGLTLSCGQFFRFFPADSGYYVQSREKVFFARQEKDTLQIRGNVTRGMIRRFFRLDEDRSELFSLMRTYPELSELPARYPGLRLIRQDPWECLISYICATAANIPKIKDNIESMARHFGQSIQFDGIAFSAFPSPGALDCEKSLRACKCGYRAPFIEAVNMSLDEKRLNRLKRRRYEKAKEELTKLPGVGEKVADCVLLFSLGHDEAFPVDTRIRRVMRRLFVRDASDSAIRAFANERFARHAGYVQQYLYLLEGGV